MSMLTLVLMGFVAGWLANTFAGGEGFGFLGDAVLGIAGAFAAYYVANSLHIPVGTGLIPNLVVATAGAFCLVVIFRLFRSA